MITKEFETEIVETGIALYREQVGCATVTQIVGIITGGVKLNQTEIDAIQSEIEFWVGKPKKG